jgi:hypothetical protein
MTNIVDLGDMQEECAYSILHMKVLCRYQATGAAIGNFVVFPQDAFDSIEERRLEAWKRLFVLEQVGY